MKLINAQHFLLRGKGANVRLAKKTMYNLVSSLFFIVLLLTYITKIAEAKEQNMNEIIQFTSDKQMVLPEGFTKVFQHPVKHNGIDVDLLRYEKSSTSANYGMENVSFLIRKDGQLEGVSRLLPEFNDTNTQLSEKESEQIALSFLKKYAPDLLINNAIQWIGKHSEEIKENGKKIKVSGMKVKCRNLTDGLYFWVIVAPDTSIMVFERDIEWDFIKAGRQTEKWLHDEWLAKTKIE